MDFKEERIIYKNISELRGNPKNPRKNDKAVDSVAKSIEKYGFRTPLIIDKNNVVWCGNTRLKASKRLGIKRVPCIVVEDLTEKQMREYALLDNKTNEIADWDFDMLKDELADLDFSDFNLDWGIKEDETKEKGEIEFSEELMLTHNYIVLYFDNDFDWEVAVDKFGLKEVKDLIPRKSQPTGIGRVINGKKVLEWKKD